ncbi:Cobyrinic acid ac-diamide synthase [Hydrogenobaculum sp. Y04AAS1]|uniref:AAA family ATPase n=1 Tax=Hydrogenobaculum sp. (strain Y04AAS1) TaxID=380749 RepID=UPI00015BD4F6|nr:Cobyrinic acid ac-diamide synthase [Hydrogenobaculum sp. Y04AAS1]HCT67011.1 MinD/ParA family protein [Hydrogenobaculum sp.]
MMEGQLSHLKRAIDKGSNTRYIAVASGKGGVGKTLISINLAMIIRNIGKRVLIIDGDFGLSNVHIMLGLTPEKNLSDFINGKASIDEIVFKINNNVSFISSGNGIQELVNLSSKDITEILDRIHEYAENNFDIIIFDTPPGLHNETLIITSSSDIPIVISTPEPTAVADAYALIKVLNTSMMLKDFYILINKCSSKEEGLKIFNSINTVSQRFLDINLKYLGYITYNKNIIRKIVDQKPFDKTLTDELTQSLKNIPLDINVQSKQGFWSKLIERLKPT